MELSWSRNRLRQEVRASLAERTGGDSSDVTGENHDDQAASGVPDPDAAEASPRAGLIQVKLTPEQMEWCQVVAVRFGRSVEEWAAAALDRAAREELSREDADEPHR